MLLNDDIFKFYLNDKLYTIQLTDNSEMKLKIKKGRKIYYVATKEELINNLNKQQEYDEKIKVYYYVNNELIQLGVKENIKELKVDYINYNMNEFEKTEEIKITNIGSYIKELPICKKVETIEYNKNNRDNFSIENVAITDNNFKTDILDKLVSIERNVINYNENTIFDFDYKNIFANNLMTHLKEEKAEFDYVILNYNNLENFTSNNIQIFSNYSELKSYTLDVVRNNYTFEDISNYTLENASKFNNFIEIEPILE